jgi:protein-S-isoprenylcysteine O-methyltransferase Ste14
MFKATALEYRFRFALHAIVFVLGFTAPWDYALHLDPRGPDARLWGTLAEGLLQLGVGNYFQASALLLAIAIALAFLGAFLRTWGAAYLGFEIVQSETMHTAVAVPSTGILQDGPFRHVRNPLYLGTFVHTLALSLLMPPSGAVFAIVAIGLLQIRLLLAEEAFLSAKLGAPYAAYCALVPRAVPALRARVAAGGLKPRWRQAITGEIYMWGVAGSFAFAGWRYNASLLTQCVLVSLGVGLVVRAVLPRSSS